MSDCSAALNINRGLSGFDRGMLIICYATKQSMITGLIVALQSRSMRLDAATYKY